MARISVNIDEVKVMLRREGMYIIKNRDEMEEALDVMTEFYRDDDLFIWFCGGEYDETTTRNIMRAGLYSMPNFIIYADSPEVNAVAAWIPPGNKNLPVIPYLKNGGIELYKQNGLGIAYKLLTYQGYASRMHKSITGKGDWYLFSYAVKPGLDYNEFSQKLLRPMTKYGWETGESCYSEVTSELGVNFMRAAGFQVRDQGRIPRSNVNYFGVMV
ncbi:MAG: hypothetical protein J5509_02785 [Lachnospiraceae bacterium]|nr:hypothetical protein [Lachnospiraceae bacterium]